MKSKIIFVDQQLKKSIYKLKLGSKSDQNLLKSIHSALSKIECNCFCGVQIPKKIIPLKYLREFGVTNLWKMNLPGGWRLLYSIQSGDVIVVSIILEVLNHKRYDRRFKY